MFYRIIWEFSQHGRRGCSQPQNLCSILTPNVPFHGGSVKTEMEGDIEQGITVGGWETAELGRDKGKSEEGLVSSNLRALCLIVSQRDCRTERDR